jgi:hypothetical protein
MFKKGTVCSPEFVTFYKRATKCTFVELSSGIISPGIFCEM